MKKYLILILLLMLAGCSSTQSGVNKEYDMSIRMAGDSKLELTINLTADTAAETAAGSAPATVTVDPKTEIKLPIPSIPAIKPIKLPAIVDTDTISLDELDIVEDSLKVMFELCKERASGEVRTLGELAVCLEENGYKGRTTIQGGLMSVDGKLFDLANKWEANK